MWVLWRNPQPKKGEFSMAERHKDSEQPGAWIAVAQIDLDAARAILEKLGSDGFAPSCYHAQQSVEKALKAWLIVRKQPYPMTHDLRLLLDRCEHAGAPWVPQARESERLISYAVVGRYPSGIRSVSRENTEEAIRIAASVLNFVRVDLGIL